MPSELLLMLRCGVFVAYSLFDIRSCSVGIHLFDTSLLASPWIEFLERV